MRWLMSRPDRQFSALIKVAARHAVAPLVL
jgi:hypothetical protein